MHLNDEWQGLTVTRYISIKNKYDTHKHTNKLENTIKAIYYMVTQLTNNTYTTRRILIFDI